MFDILDDQIKNDEEKASTKKERAIRWSLIALLSVVLFSALYFGLHLVQGG